MEAKKRGNPVTPESGVDEGGVHEGMELEGRQAKDLAAVRYTKEQILDAARYRERRDLLRALLEEGTLHSLAETDSLMEAYMKGKVN